MSETTNSSESPKPDPAIVPDENTGNQRQRRPFGAVFGLLVVIILLGIGGGIYLARQRSAQRSEIAALNARMATTNAQIGALKAQMTRLAAQQAAPRPTATEKLPASVSTEIDSLQKGTAALASRIDGLQRNTAALTATVAADHTALAGMQSNLAGVQSNLASQQSGLASVQSSLGNMPKLAARAQRMDQIAVASLALQTGQPLGTIPGAPPALARFATANPPTEATLRLAFPDAARRAVLAGGDVQATGGFWNRVKMRAANLVTVQRGSDVLVGSRAKGIVATAQRNLDAGDLHDAVAALNTLPPPAKSAMQGWIDQAEALQAARKALASIAEPQ